MSARLYAITAFLAVLAIFYAPDPIANHPQPPKHARPEKTESTMHNGIQIAEIQDRIVQYISRHTSFQLVLTCRAFYDPAIEISWASVARYAPLVKCMPAEGERRRTKFQQSKRRGIVDEHGSQHKVSTSVDSSESLIAWILSRTLSAYALLLITS